VNDSVCGGRLVTIHACAAALYSDKAHHHWDSPDTAGVDRLRQRIFRALNAYERRLLHLDAAREPAPRFAEGEELVGGARQPSAPIVRA
jgi:hypothetical protein